MSEKQPIYRLNDDKVLAVSFPRPPLKLDGDFPTYEVPGSPEPRTALSTEVTAFRKADPGWNPDGAYSPP